MYFKVNLPVNHVYYSVSNLMIINALAKQNIRYYMLRTIFFIFIFLIDIHIDIILLFLW